MLTHYRCVRIPKKARMHPKHVRTCLEAFVNLVARHPSGRSCSEQSARPPPRLHCQSDSPSSSQSESFYECKTPCRQTSARLTPPSFCLTSENFVQIISVPPTWRLNNAYRPDEASTAFDRKVASLYPCQQYFPPSARPPVRYLHCKLRERMKTVFEFTFPLSSTTLYIYRNRKP